MASAGYDIAITRSNASNNTVAPGDQVSTRTDFPGTVENAPPTAINGVNTDYHVIGAYVRLMVVSQGSITCSCSVSATGIGYVGHGNVQTGWAIDASLTSFTGFPSWAALPFPGVTNSDSANTTLTTTYSSADTITNLPQGGSQWFNDTASNAPTNIQLFVTGNLTGYWAAALLV